MGGALSRTARTIRSWHGAEFTRTCMKSRSWKRSWKSCEETERTFWSYGFPARSAGICIPTRSVGTRKELKGDARRRNIRQSIRQPLDEADAELPEAVQETGGGGHRAEHRRLRAGSGAPVVHQARGGRQYQRTRRARPVDDGAHVPGRPSYPRVRAVRQRLPHAMDRPEDDPRSADAALRTPAETGIAILRPQPDRKADHPRDERHRGPERNVLLGHRHGLQRRLPHPRDSLFHVHDELAAGARFAERPPPPLLRNVPLPEKGPRSLPRGAHTACAHQQLHAGTHHRA